MIWGGSDVIIQIKCTINIIQVDHPQTATIPSPWKNCLPRNRFLVPRRLGTSESCFCFCQCWCLVIFCLPHRILNELRVQVRQCLLRGPHDARCPWGCSGVRPSRVQVLLYSRVYWSLKNFRLALFWLWESEHLFLSSVLHSGTNTAFLLAFQLNLLLSVSK